MKDKFLSLLKSFFVVLLIPLVIGVTAAFLEDLRLMHTAVSGAFGWGVVVYLILHILLYQPSKAFDTGKKMAEKAVGFLTPLVKITGFLFPFFTLLSFVLYYFAALIWKQTDLFPLFSFFASFTFTMHMVMTANNLKNKQPGALRENYLFSIFLIYCLNMMIIAGAFSFLSDDFSFIHFSQGIGRVAGAIYSASFRQLFVVE